MEDTHTSHHTRVLVVDEDTGCRMLVREILSDAGADVRDCARAEDAPALVGSCSLETIILDLVAGDEALGLGVLEALMCRSSPHAPRVVISSTSDSLLREHAATFERFGCQTILKPYDVDELLRVVLSPACPACV